MKRKMFLGFFKMEVSMEIVIYVEGMMCEHCKKKVEKGLKAIKGVKKVKVFLESNSVFVRYNEKKVNLEVIKREIVNLGYEVK